MKIVSLFGSFFSCSTKQFQNSTVFPFNNFNSYIYNISWQTLSHTYVTVIITTTLWFTMCWHKIPNELIVRLVFVSNIKHFTDNNEFIVPFPTKDTHAHTLRIHNKIICDCIYITAKHIEISSIAFEYFYSILKDFRTDVRRSKNCLMFGLFTAKRYSLYLIILVRAKQSFSA